MKYLQQLYNAQKAQLAIASSSNVKQDLFITDNEVKIGSKLYVPPATLKLFHNDSASTRIVLGPFGSGKSSTMCADIIMQAAAMPICADGVRRSRCGVFRNSYKQLMQTSLRTWRYWVDHTNVKAKYHLSAPLESKHVFHDEHGRIELEIFYISIDSILQIDDLKSLELTNAWLNEGSELPRGILEVISGRCGRYPAPIDLDYRPYRSGIILCSNAPDEDHWIPNLERQATETTGHSVLDYRIYERKYEYVDEDEKRETLVHIYHQPPALKKNKNGDWEANELAENIKNVGGYKYYFERLQNSENYIKVYVLGEYGTISDNQVVYESYNDDLHSVNDIDIDAEEPILLTWDFGTTSPACLLSQFIKGKLYVIKEFCASWISIKELADNVVKPWLAKNTKRMAMESVGDPAGTDHGFAQLEEAGILTDTASTNKVQPRIDAVRDFLNKLVRGQPKIVISRLGCPKLRQGFLRRYYYRRLQVVGEEAYKDVPHKNHPFSDCFAAGTKILMSDGSEKNIEDIRPGVMVRTPNGERKVTHAWLARENATVYKYIFSNGRSLVATPEHKMFTNNGWIEIDRLQYIDVLLSISNKLRIWSWLRLFANNAGKGLKLICGELTRAKVSIVQTFAGILVCERGKGLRLMENGSLLTTGGILNTKARMEQQSNCTDISGKNITVKFPEVNAFITKTGMRPTMISRIWRSWINQNTLACMPTKDLKNIRKLQCVELLRRKRQPKNGTGQKKVENGTPGMGKKFGLRERNKNLNAQYVEVNTKHILSGKAFVLLPAKLKQGARAAWTMLCGIARAAAKSLQLINIQKLRLAETRIVSKKSFPEGKDVYDLTVESEHCFYANGLLSHNCHDCLQYAALHFNALELSQDDEFLDYDSILYDEETRSKIGGY